MCGYCTEVAAFDILRESKPEDIGLFFSEFYLQESPEPLAAVNQVANIARKEGQKPYQAISGTTFLCRVIDILLEKGFDSSKYQQSITRPLYSKILKQAFPGSQNLSGVAARFGISRFAALYDLRNFTSSDLCSDLSVSGPNIWEAGEIVHRYIEWWLEGKGLLRDKEREDVEGIVYIAESEYTAFDTIFRALWFSLNILGRCPEEKDLLWALVTKSPLATPMPDPKDLWIQRKAALMLYDMEALDPFLKRLDQFRPSLLGYLDFRRGFNTQDKARIAKRLEDFPPGEIHDDSFDLNDLLAAG